MSDDTTETEPPESRDDGTRKRLAILFGVGVALLLVLLGVSQTQAFREQLRTRVVPIVNTQLAGELSVGRIEGNLLGGVELHAVDLRDARGNLTAYVPKISVRYTLHSALSRTLDVAVVTVERPRVVLRRYQDGAFNLSLLAKPAEAPTSSDPIDFTVRVRSLTVEDAAVVFVDEAGSPIAPTRGAVREAARLVDQSGARFIEAPADFTSALAALEPLQPYIPTLAALTDVGVTLDATWSLAGALDASVSEARGRIHMDTLSEPLALTSEALELEASAEVVRMTHAKLAIGEGTGYEDLRAGVVLDLDNPALLTDLYARTDSARLDAGLLATLKPAIGLASDLEASFVLGGTPADTAAKVVVRRVGGDDELTARATFAHVLTWVLTGGDSATPTYTAEVVARELEPDGYLALGIPGTLNADLSASGAGLDPETIVVRATTHVFDTVLMGFQLESLDATATLNRDTATLEHALVRTPYLDASASGRATLDGSIHLDAGAYTEERHEREVSIPRGPDSAPIILGQQRAKLSASVDATLDPSRIEDSVALLTTLDVDASWDVGALRAEGIVVGASRGKAALAWRSPGPARRTLSYDVDAVVGVARAPDGIVARDVVAKAKGEAGVVLPVEDLLDVVRGVRADATFRAAHLEVPGVRVARADVTTRVRPHSSIPEAFAFDVDGAISSVSTSIGALASLAQARADVGGYIALDFETREPLEVIDSFSVAGSFGASAFRGLGVSLGQTKGTFDTKGTLRVPTGSVDLEANQLDVAVETLERVQLFASLAPSRAFAVKLGVERTPGEDHKPRGITASTSGALSAALDDLRLDRLRVASASGSTWSGPSEDGSAARVTWRGGVATVEGFAVSNGDQQLVIDGVYRSVGDQELHAEAKNLDLDRFLEDFALTDFVPDIGGFLEKGRVDLEGTSRDPVIILDVRADRLRYTDYGPLSIDIKGRYKNTRLTLTRFDLDGWGRDLVDLQLRMALKLDFERGSEIYWTKPIVGTLVVHEIDFTALQKDIDELKDLRARGAISGGAIISGSLSRPTASMNLTASGLGVDTGIAGQRVRVSGVGASAKIDYEPPSRGGGGLVVASSVTWQREDPVATLDLSVPLPIVEWVTDFYNEGKLVDLYAATLGQPLKLRATLDRFDLSKLDVSPLLTQTDVVGVLNASVTGEGTFDDPQLFVRANVGRIEEIDGEEKEVDGFGYGIYRDVIVDLSANIEDKTFRLERFLLNWDLDDILRATATVQLPLDDLYAGRSIRDLSYAFDVELARNELNKLSVASYELFGQLRGQIEGSIRGRGTLRRPEVEGEFELDRVSLGKYTTGALTASFSARDDIVQSAFRFGELKGGEPLEWLIGGLIARVDLDLIDLLAEGRNPLEVSGISRPKRTLPLDDARKGRRTLVLEASDDLAVYIHTPRDRPIDLARAIPAQPTDKLASKLAGLLSIDLDVGGTYARPIPEGKIQLEKGRVYVEPLAREFHDIDLLADVDQYRATLHKFVLREGTGDVGEVTAKGTLKHKSLRPSVLAMSAESRHFNAGGFVGYPAFVDSSVVLDGDLSTQPLRATIDISDVVAVLPDNFTSTVQSTERRGDVVVLGPGDTLERELAIDGLSSELTVRIESIASLLDADVDVSMDSDSQVKTPYGDVSGGGQLRLTLRGGTPRVTGELVASGGDVDFLNRQFDVDSGVVTFVGASPPNPQLAIESSYPMRKDVMEALAASGKKAQDTARIIVRITGTALDPNLKLRSDPALTETEILFILATDRPPDDANVGEDAGVVNAALNAASGLFIGLLKQELAVKLPVDVLKVTTSSLEVGKYLTPNVLLSYSRQFEGNETQAANVVSIEYTFLPKWTIQAQYSGTAKSEFNIYWDVK